MSIQDLWMQSNKRKFAATSDVVRQTQIQHRARAALSGRPEVIKTTLRVSDIFKK